jgi:DNA-binding MarR family transcriptional regulator
VEEQPLYRRIEVPDGDNKVKVRFVDEYGVIQDEYVKSIAKPKGNMAKVVKVNDPFVRLYRNNVQQVIRDGALTLYEFGVLVQLACFTGWGTTFVTDDNGQRLSLSQLADLLGLSKGYLSTILKSLDEKGFVTIYKPENSRANFVMVNGSISFFGKWLNDEEEAEAFNDSPYEPLVKIVHPKQKKRGGGKK